MSKRSKRKGRRIERSHQRWAQLRLSVVGQLLAAPPERGELSEALRLLARTWWKHPITDEPVRFGYSTIERWYYAAKEADDPVGALRRKIRSDAGSQRVVTPEASAALVAQHRDHPYWSYQLHADNLAALCKASRHLGAAPSYATVRRHLQAKQLLRRKKKRRHAGQVPAFAAREMRSFEVEHVGGLWHTHYQECSRAVSKSYWQTVPSGRLVKPDLFAMLEDCSRLCCHAQWYWEECSESFAHGTSQAFQKRGLPRGLLSDNGGAMTAAEIEQCFERLGIEHFTTLPNTPEQNGKQEKFWDQVEGRLMAMLEGVADLSLKMLNDATQAWVQREYNRSIHSELGQTPLERFLYGKNVHRRCPSPKVLRQSFATEEHRTPRRSDGTLSIEGVRFELPSRYRHLRRVCVRYARWDLSRAWLADERTGILLCTLLPLDKARNADRVRRPLPTGSGDDAVIHESTSSGIAPLLQHLIDEHNATGLPPAYLPKDKGAGHQDNDDIDSNNTTTTNDRHEEADHEE
jgi:putative transposase